jgi:GT2 family glycosyltransferase
VIFVVDNLASIIIVSYNHRKYLKSCIDSIKNQDYPHEIIVVDNESADGSPGFIESTYPDVRLVRNKNTGYGAGNNLGVQFAKGDYVVFLNPDTIVEKNFLWNLIAPIALNSRTITTPKILIYDGSAINTCGNINHFTGLTFTRGLLEPPQAHSRQEAVSGISGACFAMRREEFTRMGGFDERFFLYNEDSEFSWRAHLFDLPIVYVPRSIVRHDYSLAVSPQKMYYLEKGRYLILKKYFSWKIAVILLPSLVAAEILTFGYAARFGRAGMSLKLRALCEGVFQKDGQQHLAGVAVLEHLEVQVPDDQLTSTGIERGVVRVCNRVFSWNFSIFKRMFRKKE